jgi:exodeoxyribonuclease III
MPDEIKILSWNVNGLRSVAKKGFLKYLYNQDPDILCLQETKAQPDQLEEELVKPKGYFTYWNYPEERKGYSSVAIYAKQKPISVKRGMGQQEYDSEGRILVAEYGAFTLFCVYFPKGDVHPPRIHRLKYKLAFYDAFLEHLDLLRKSGKKLIICGDFNTAHTAIDIARPKENEKASGFLPVERAWIDKLISHGFVDTFRRFHEEPNQYTWWDSKTRAKERNVGWRLDYFFVSDNLIESVQDSFILDNVKSIIGSDASDHCPVGIILRI